MFYDGKLWNNSEFIFWVSRVICINLFSTCARRNIHSCGLFERLAEGVIFPKQSLEMQISIYFLTFRTICGSHITYNFSTLLNWRINMDINSLLFKCQTDGGRWVRPNFMGVKLHMRINELISRSSCLNAMKFDGRKKQFSGDA